VVDKVWEWYVAKLFVHVATDIWDIGPVDDIHWIEILHEFGSDISQNQNKWLII
jgi:hypothetical protein